MTPTWNLALSALWPWTWRYCLGSRSWHILGSSTYFVWNIIQIRSLQSKVMARTRILAMCALWPWPCRHDLGSRSWHTLRSCTTIVWNIKILSRCEIAVESYGPDTIRTDGQTNTRTLVKCALWPWLWKYDLGSRSWHTIGSWTTILLNIIQIQGYSRKLWPGLDLNRRTDRVIPMNPPKLCLQAV